MVIKENYFSLKKVHRPIYQRMPVKANKKYIYQAYQFNLRNNMFKALTLQN